MNYGLPYQGSKNGIAKWVIDHLPKAEVFVDVFAGGCAVTHAAMLSGKYKRFVVNDITDVPQLFVNAINGKYRDERRWISREDFFRLKDTDPYVRYCWSFGNDGKTYMYGKEVEPWKKALHYARVLGDNSLLCEFGINSDGSRSDIRKHSNEYKRNYIDWYVREVLQSLQRLQRLESLQRLQSLERLQRLQSLQSLQSLQRLQSPEVYQLDYRELQIPDNAVIYCDPPYKGTRGYLHDFDHNAFYDWCRNLNRPVYISEYSMPDDFTKIDSKQKRVTFSANNNKERAEECLFGYNVEKIYRETQLTLF